MSRVTATALVLVNWKGVFYERYELDRHVTALEGDNGAGKTTVMIAAYVALLPDMSRLRFTNLGETGATGGDKGIWGRLGEAGRPAYSALEFCLSRGERLIAGVHLERKGEPTVEPTPFLVTGLQPDVRLQDLLLLTQGDLDVVPELSELRDNAGRLGGRLQVFSSAKDYFAALFEHGVTPMRLGTDEERNKLNEMLKTSMTGGMSKGLLQELRSFLLKEEGGLAETLGRMRANLDACRRTRTEVTEAQRLEQEIGAVYEAGEAMFAAAVAATRQRAEEMTRRVAEKEAALVDAEGGASAAADALRSTQEALELADFERASAREEREAAQVYEARVAEAVRWAKEKDQRDRALADAELHRTQGERTRADADLAFHQATERVAQASDSRERAAAGLADLQAGLEELHRRANAHRRVVDRLQTARRELELPDFDPAAAYEVAEHARRDLAGIDRERRELLRQIGDAEAHRGEYAAAWAALTRLVKAPVELDEAWETAGSALGQVVAWRLYAERRAERAAEVRRLEAEEERQRQVSARAQALGLAWAPGDGLAALHRALLSAEVAKADAESRARSAEAGRDEAGRQLAKATETVRTLERRAVEYRALEASAVRLGDAVAAPVSSRSELESARATLRDRTDQHRDEHRRLLAQQEELRAEARHLRQAGGSFPAALLALRDTLGAELLAAHFDEVPPGQAAHLEARLGPLAQALVVPDVARAAQAAAARPEALPTVWLVAEDASLVPDLGVEAESDAQRDVQVREGEALRVTRVPERPTLGRTAREQRASELEAQARDLDGPIARYRQGAREGTELLKEADRLLEGLIVWLLGDPGPESDEARRVAGEADRARREADQLAKSSWKQAADLDPHVRALRGLLPEARLLDVPDLTEPLARARAHLQASYDAETELARVGDAPQTLERLRDALRRPPWSEEDVRREQERLRDLDQRRDRLAAGLEAVHEVMKNAPALAWTDAEAQLSARQGLVPALQAQLDAAKRTLEVAQAGERDAREGQAQAQAAFNRVDAAYMTAREQRDEAARRLASTGVDEPSPALFDAARERVKRAGEHYDRTESRWGHLREDLGRRQADAEARERAAQEARAAVEDERKQARPAIDGWDRLRPRIESSGLMAAALSERFLALFGGKGSVNLYPIAQSRRDLLVERLRVARGSAEVLSEVHRWMDAADQTTAEGYLGAWIAVRDWLRARLPAQIAEGDEPLVALDRFREHLSGLLERLDRQEQELRGASEDVARSIDVQIRKAQGRVARLNEHLKGVQFGSVRGIRVKMQRVETMERVLRALRSGEAQALLFQAGLPFEDALEEIFRRYGGGRTGGQRLLDYREYLDLQVEVARVGSQVWELAHPTRLSTGEAIGVGAALMMVVLTEWERDANLLRGRRAFGSLRFLFLDEANRLDQANLGTVFDLCRNLDLQLLVAAPEVARAEGCTVFRLVRTRGEDGAEQVLVSGRRVVGEA